MLRDTTFTFQSDDRCRFELMNTRLAKFTIGQVVRHRVYPQATLLFEAFDEGQYRLRHGIGH